MQTSTGECYPLDGDIWCLIACMRITNNESFDSWSCQFSEGGTTGVSTFRAQLASISGRSSAQPPYLHRKSELNMERNSYQVVLPSGVQELARCLSAYRPSVISPKPYCHMTSDCRLYLYVIPNFSRELSIPNISHPDSRQYSSTTQEHKRKYRHAVFLSLAPLMRV